MGEQNGRHSADDIFKCISLSKKCRILIRVVPGCAIYNKAVLVHMVVRWRTGNKRNNDDKEQCRPMASLGYNKLTQNCMSWGGCCFCLNLEPDFTLHKSSLYFWHKSQIWLKAADDDAGKLQPLFLKRLYLLHICIFSFFLFNASLTTI